MCEKCFYVAYAIIFLWMVLSLSELDVRWFGTAIDGGLLRPLR